MISGMYRVACDVIAQQQNHRVIASNLAGSNQAGFKGRSLPISSFKQEFDQAHSGSSLDTFGVKTGEPRVDFSQGTLRRTNRALDFAVMGEGFFQVRTPDGKTLLTRNGTFYRSPEGTLQTKEGYTVQGTNGAIRIGEQYANRNLHVQDDGTLTAQPRNGAEVTVGQIKLVTVNDKQQLDRLSATYYRPTEQQELQTPEQFQVRNRYLEQANISPIHQMADMIETVREYEAGQKMIRMFRQTAQQENRKLS